MYSMIIADDEEIERRALKLLISRNFGDTFHTEEAANGIELVNKVTTSKPDIAIVDINMPGMNGLEAIRLLKDKGENTKIIIYTAYGQFEYAQEAVRLGADDYILKPAKRERILSVVSKYKDMIDGERREECEKKRLKRMIDELGPIIESDFMSSIFLEDIDINRFNIFLDILHIKFVSGFFITVLISCDNAGTSECESLETSKQKTELPGFIKEELSNICNCITSSIVNSKVTVFVPLDKELPFLQFKVWALELSELLNDRIKEHFGLNLQIGIGNQYNSIERLPVSYRESINALNDNSVKNTIKFFGDVCNENDVRENYLTKYGTEISRLISEGDGKGCEEIIERFFIEKNANMSLDLEREAWIGLIISIWKNLSKSQADINKVRLSLQACYTQLIEADTHDHLKCLLKKQITAMIEGTAQTKRDRMNRFVRAAASYVNINYTKDISLEMVAVEIGISSFYLSRLFKQELGLNFVDYLTEIRIKNAIRLIKTKDYSIKELSEKVGYYNPTYFSKVFKKVTGKTIHAYRMEELQTPSPEVEG